MVMLDGPFVSKYTNLGALAVSGTIRRSESSWWEWVHLNSICVSVVMSWSVV